VYLVLYAIAVCAFSGALVVQLKFMSRAGLPLPMLMLKPWKGVTVMADAQKVLAAPGQIGRFVLFMLLLIAGVGALLAGRSIQLGRPLF
jgi:hypothetical protein